MVKMRRGVMIVVVIMVDEEEEEVVDFIFPTVNDFVNIDEGRSVSVGSRPACGCSVMIAPQVTQERPYLKSHGRLAGRRGASSGSPHSGVGGSHAINARSSCSPSPRALPSLFGMGGACKPRLPGGGHESPDAVLMQTGSAPLRANAWPLSNDVRYARSA
jgi:hypothetical protein